MGVTRTSEEEGYSLKKKTKYKIFKKEKGYQMFCCCQKKTPDHCLIIKEEEERKGN